jgi:hydroxyproline transport system permease protein
LEILTGWLPHLDFTFHFGQVWRSLPKMLFGTLVTIELAVLSMVIGLVIAIVLAIARQAQGGITNRLAGSWVEAARNTPALFQVYMMYFGLGALGLHLSPFFAVLLAMTFNNAGYLAETLRGGFNSVPKAQMSACRTLGMTRFQANRYVIVPQVLRAIYFPITNQMIAALQMTSLGMMVGLKELAGVTQSEQSISYRTFEFFLIAGLIYYVVAKLIMAASRLFGRRLLGTH